MKFNFEDRKYFLWGATAFGVVAASMLLYYTIFHMNTVISGIRFFLSVIAPVIYGFVIAYILSGVVKFFEEQVVYFILDKKGIKPEARVKRIIRWLCVFFSLALLIIFIYTLIMMILPQLIRSITTIIYSFPSYTKILETWLNSVVEKGWNLDDRTIDLLNRYSVMAQNYLTGTILPRLQEVVMNFSNGVFNVMTVIKNFLVGAIVALYFLADKESFIAKGKMFLYAFLSKEHANKIIHALRFTHKVFGGFISGKLLDSLLIGILCYIGISILRIPYSILVSVIIGVTNIIPFFGPYLGAIPCAFLILLVSPVKGLYFIIFILILQQFDGNILGPKILGNSTGLSSFLVILAILIGGGFFGIAGMVVGVPLFAVFYASLMNILQSSLSEKGLPSEEKTYTNIDCLDAETGDVKTLKEERFFFSTSPELPDNRFTKTYRFCEKMIKLLLKFIVDTYKKCSAWTQKQVAVLKEKWNRRRSEEAPGEQEATPVSAETSASAETAMTKSMNAETAEEDIQQSPTEKEE